MALSLDEDDLALLGYGSMHETYRAKLKTRWSKATVEQKLAHRASALRSYHKTKVLKADRIRLKRNAISLASFHRRKAAKLQDAESAR